jgi:hypothetical protein
MRLYQPTVQRVPSSFLWVKRPGPEVDPSSPCSAEVKNEWNYIYSSPACLHGVERDNCIFTFKILFSLYHETQNYGVGEGVVEIRLTVKKIFPVLSKLLLNHSIFCKMHILLMGFIVLSLSLKAGFSVV